MRAGLLESRTSTAILCDPTPTLLAIEPPKVPVVDENVKPGMEPQVTSQVQGDFPPLACRLAVYGKPCVAAGNVG